MFEATRHATGEMSAAPGPAAALPGDRDLQRASGAGRITLRGSDRGTEVVDVYQKFPTRIMVPTIGDGALKEVVVINASGGIAGGDRLEFEVTALGNSQVTVTSQAAEKIYRALDQPAHVVTRLKVQDAAKLAWLPQETIIFDSARIRRQIEIDLCAGTELMALEWLVLGPHRSRRGSRAGRYPRSLAGEEGRPFGVGR